MIQYFPGPSLRLKLPLQAAFLVAIQLVKVELTFTRFGKEITWFLKMSLSRSISWASTILFYINFRSVSGSNEIVITN